MLSNTPAMLECHFGVPMARAVLHSLNTRLDAAALAFQLDHAETRVLIVDQEFSAVVAEALALAKTRPLVVDYDDPEYPQDAAYPKGEPIGSIDYEDWLATGDEDFAWLRPQDEWDAISLNYTSGTTGDPGVVYHHRRRGTDGSCQYDSCRAGPALCLSVDPADVSLQWLVFHLDPPHAGRDACLPALGAGWTDL